jgi:opacity protein-like surface antigen
MTVDLWLPSHGHPSQSSIRCAQSCNPQLALNRLFTKQGVVMKKIVLLAASIYLIGSSLASAEGLTGEPVCCDWRGLYFGGYFGAGQGDASSTFRDESTNTFTFTQPGVSQTLVTNEIGSGSLSGEITGAQADLFVGYNLPVGSRLLLGIQGEGTPWSTYTLKTKGSRRFEEEQVQTVTVGAVTTVTRASTSGSGTFELTDELDAMVALVGRAGVLVGENILLYGIGGVVGGQFVVPDSDDPFGGEREQWEMGYTVGAGGEVKLGCCNWSLRAEYRFYQFDYDRNRSNSDSQVTVQNLTTQTNENQFSRHASTDLDLHTGKVGVVYRFCGLMGSC